MPLRFVRQAVANNTAKSLVLIVEFGAQRLAAVAARITSSKSHSPLISTLRTSFRFGRDRKNFVILSEVEESRGNEMTNFFCARTTIVNYSLFIINLKSTHACFFQFTTFMGLFCKNALTLSSVAFNSRTRDS